MLKQDFDIRETGMLNALTKAYLNKVQGTEKLYVHFPEIESFEAAIALKEKSVKHREVLVSALQNDYKNVPNNVKALQNIALLANENTFTVTTGHQLCLFTGPLYFIYKIQSAINLCVTLKARFPDKNFVPVYWMATEDHDFDEVNHAHILDKTFRWEHQASGAVGRISTAGLKPLLDEVQAFFSQAPERFQAYVKQFLHVYRTSENLSEATRLLVHQLFGEQGLVCVDGDNASLKACFKKVHDKELFEQESSQALEQSSNIIQDLGFSPLVSGREINLFYLKDAIRERIIRNAEVFEVLNTSIRFTEDEIKNELSAHPERFSPNVMLRPLYQECILPNLAYFGGGAEVTYWLQLKPVFETFDIPMPVVMLRNSFLFVSPKVQRKMAQLQMDIADLFKDKQELSKQVVSKLSGEPENALESIFTDFEKVQNQLYEALNSKDESLARSAEAHFVRFKNNLAKLDKKRLRLLKRKHGEVLLRLDEIFAELFPKGVPQERYVNVLEMQFVYGHDFQESIRNFSDAMNWNLGVVKA
jgi:bacillithiol biosynthesis cysteine-adding enzyme BshC